MERGIRIIANEQQSNERLLVETRDRLLANS